MNTGDFSGYIVIYNLVIGILLILAGSISVSHRQSIVRLVRVSTVAFGSTVTALMAFIYLVFHLFQLSM